MRFLKPLFAILIVNLAIIVAFGLIIFILKIFFGVDILNNGNYTNLFLYSFLVGFIGSFISLLTSKFVIKYLYGIKIISPDIYEELKNDISNPLSQKIVYLYDRIQQLSNKYNIGNIELGIYESGEPNAFATGCGLCGRLIAFSTAILEVMDIDELDGVLGHEFAHIMNGDMITTTILQGFLNTFVIFISRLLSGFIISLQSSDENENKNEENNSFLYYLLSTILEFLLGLVVSIVLAWYSRVREYSADKDSGLKFSKLDNMIKALKKLKFIEESGNIYVDSNNDVAATLKIYNFANKLLYLFSTHPPLEDRIRKLEELKSKINY